MKKKLESQRKQDYKSIIFIVFLVVASGLTIRYFANVNDNEEENKSNYERKGNANKYYAQPGENDGSRPATKDYELFPFDPNTADSTELLRLGLEPFQVRGIYHYRSKGGRFRYKENFARVPGLSDEKYKELEPYIRIKQEVMAADVVKQPSYYHGNRSYGNGNNQKIAENQKTSGYHGEYSGSGSYPYKVRYGEKIDINTADTTQLKRIPGIGSYFAVRIIEMRARHQMFQSPEELLSIRNFPETALEYMTASQDFPKIHINKLTQQELAHHPLLNYTQARDISALRRTTGAIHNIKEMSVLQSFTPKHLQRVEKYIVFD